MREKFTRWNQYGFDKDVFDKYRDAVLRSNRDAIKVLSLMAVCVAVMLAVYGVLVHEKVIGFVLCGALAVTGIAGTIISFRSGSSRKNLLIAAYFISVCFYNLAIYGTVSRGTDAFWIGIQMAIGCYLLDYAWKVGLLQLIAWLLLMLVWRFSGAAADWQRLLFNGIFLAASLVTFYTMNRTRISLIMDGEENREAADTDLLTGLTIRKAAQEEIERHLKTDEHGVMMLMDLDRFKSVNDKLGHQMGDRVLIEVAADLKKMFRNSDVLSRLGGDEFVVYMKSVPEKEWAQQRADQMVREVRRWVGNGTINIQVTASVGIVMTEMVGRNYDDLYRAADTAMYRAKGQGGNKAVFYTSDMPDGGCDTGEDIPPANDAMTAAPAGTAEDLR